MLTEIQKHFLKHEIEVRGKAIVVDGYEFEFYWCPASAMRISRAQRIPYYDWSNIAVYMLIERIERIFGTVRY